MSNRAIRRRLRLAMGAVFLAVVANSLIPIFPVKAKLIETDNRAFLTQAIIGVNLPVVQSKEESYRVKKIHVRRSILLRASAYSSTRDQTDADPWTTASGKRVHEGTIAMNCLPFGTKVRIPAKFGGKVFTVEDRMHAKWGCGRADIWMPSREIALDWGVRTVRIEVI